MNRNCVDTKEDIYFHEHVVDIFPSYIQDVAKVVYGKSKAGDAILNYFCPLHWLRNL